MFKRKKIKELENKISKLSIRLGERDKDYIEMSFKNSELINSNKKLKNQVDKLKRQIKKLKEIK